MYRVLPVRVAGRINNKGFRWRKGERREREREREKEKERRQGDSSGLMFICGFISFTVWSSFTVRIISLSHSHIPPLRPRPRPSRSTLPAPSMAIKILSATLLKNYRAFPLRPRPRRAPRENPSRSRQLSTNASRSHFLFISPYRLFIFSGSFGSLRSPSSSRYHIHHSTSLQGLLFARLPVSSCSLHLSYSLALRISHVSSYCSGSLLYPYLPSLILLVAVVLSIL